MKKLIHLSYLILTIAKVANAADVTVIGSKQAEKTLQGSGRYVEREEIEKHQAADINRILKTIPGVYVREEDGLGLFPNISLRGVDPNRSSKVTIMEDGVLIAPAPYSAPAAYFFPNADRMQAIEVLKGSSQIAYGPQTTGGVLNFQSRTLIADDRDKHLAVRSFVGNQGEQKNHLHYAAQNSKGFGLSIELYQRNHDGFKFIQTPNNRNHPSVATQDTGMTLFEPQVMMSYETQKGVYQKIEGKLGMTLLKANETYLGLTDVDFANSPQQRYYGTRFDHFSSEQQRSYLRHFIEFNPHWSLTSTAYYNQFERQWYKIQKVNGDNLPTAMNSAGSRSVLRGEAAGTLNIRNSDRHYQTTGIEQTLVYRQNYASHDQQWTLGLRYHYDYMITKDFTEDLEQSPTGAIINSSRSIPGHRKDSAIALASYLQNQLSWNKLTVTPGIRTEQVNFATRNHQESTSTVNNESRSLSTVTAGVGSTYQLSEDHSLYSGIFQGVALPAPRDFIQKNIQKEKSLAFEVGHQSSFTRNLFINSTLFYSQFRNLYIPENLITGATQSENAGDIDSLGLELQVNWQLDDIWRLHHLSHHLIFSSTYTRSRLKNDANSQAAGSFFNGGKKNNRAPYIPDWQLSAAYHIGQDTWNIRTSFQYTGHVWSTAENKNRSMEDARIGGIPEFFTVDVTAEYEVMPNIRASLSCLNLTNQKYMVSRHAYGPRPGRPFAILTGLQASF